jgi:hypothetical protein
VGFEPDTASSVRQRLFSQGYTAAADTCVGVRVVDEGFLTYDRAVDGR